jgi:hypothetical protein
VLTIKPKQIDTARIGSRSTAIVIACFVRARLAPDEKMQSSAAWHNAVDHECRSHFGTASFGRSAGQVTYDRAQFGLLHRIRCFLGRDPLDLTLAALWPLLSLTAHFQWEDMHLADHKVTGLQALFVEEGPDRARGNCSNNTGLFESLARSRIVRCLALVWSTFWDDPSSRLS